MHKGGRKSDTPGLIRKASGIYWIVIHIPTDVQRILEKTKHHQSTQTRDKARALEIWGRVNAEWRENIRHARSGQLRKATDGQLRIVAEAFLGYAGQNFPMGFVRGLSDVTSRFDEWASEEPEIVFEHTYDDGGPQGETATHETLRLQSLLEADRVQLATLILDRHVRSLEARSNASLMSASKLKLDAAAIRSASEGKLPDGKVRLMDIFPRWEATQRLAQTIEEGRHACEAFIALNGDLPVAEFTRQHGIAFADHLAALRHKDGKPFSVNTHAKKIGAVRAVFFSAMDRDPALTVNPLSRIKVPGVHRGKRRARGVGPRNEGWSIPELQKLFQSPVYARGHRTAGCGGEAAFWLPLLALYSGARQSELAQLDAADVKSVKGIPTLHITNENDDGRDSGTQEKRLKTGDMARRYVPIHSRLVKSGFLDYVKTVPKSGKLFPDMRPGAHGKWGEIFSKWFGRYRRTHAGIARRWADFHAMRHTFTSACRSAGILTADHEYLTAHSSTNVGGTYRYSDRTERGVRRTRRGPLRP